MLDGPLAHADDPVRVEAPGPADGEALAVVGDLEERRVRRCTAT